MPKNKNKNFSNTQGGSIAALSARSNSKLTPYMGYMLCLALLSNRILPMRGNKLPSVEEATSYVMARIAKVNGGADPEIPDTALGVILYAVQCQRMLARERESVLMSGRYNDAITAEVPIDVIATVPAAPVADAYQPVTTSPPNPYSPAGYTPPPVDPTPHWYQPGADANPEVNWLQDMFNGGSFNWGRS